MLMLDFFDAVRTFYGWVFPLNLMVTVSILGGIAAGALARPGSWLRRIFPAACLGILLVTELVWQLYPSEYLILFDTWGWCAEAALLGTAIGAASRRIGRELLRRICMK